MVLFMLGALLSISVLAVFILGFFLQRRSRELLRLQTNLSKVELDLAKEVDKKNIQNNEVAALKNRIETNILNDALTGLPSRQIFTDRLQQVLHQSARYNMAFAILFLNLDRFKIINDTLGLNAGDEILKEAAVRMQSSIRQLDSLARFGGDEFVFILTQLAKPETAVYVAQRLLETIAQPFHIQDQDVFITASIGIAIYPNDGDNSDVLLKNADNALHQAKRHGSNNYQFYQKEMYNLSRRELILNSSLRSKAIYRELQVYYQPQLNVEMKKIISMEAILQWQHPDFGHVPQEEFFPLAEATGIIVPIGDWLLRTACQQFKKWQSLTVFPQYLAVKISARQLESPHFAFTVSQILQELQLHPSVLMLEISEMMLYAKTGMIEKSLHMLKHLGIQIGLSDFGTGKLALQDLRSFPISYLKIAGALVKEIGNKETGAIIQMIIALGNTLGLRVIAEGVENEDQKRLLIHAGCILMQGSYFSSPILAQDYSDIFEKNII